MQEKEIQERKKSCYYITKYDTEEDSKTEKRENKETDK